MMIHSLISLLVLTAKWCSSGECGSLDNHEDPFTHHQSFFYYTRFVGPGV